MADLIKKIKIKKQDGTFSDYIPIGANAVNVETSDGESVELKLNKKPYCYNTVANMKADTKLKAGDMAITLGYYEANDGGGAKYQIVNNSQLVDDGGSVHNLVNGLKAQLIVNDSVNVKQFGAYGDGEHDDTAAIQNTIEYLFNKFENGTTTNYFKYINVVQFTEGIYRITDTIDFPNVLKLSIIGSVHIVVDVDNISGIWINSRNIAKSTSYMFTKQPYISGSLIDSQGSLTISKKTSDYSKAGLTTSTSVGLEIGDRVISETLYNCVSRISINNVNILGFNTALALNSINVYCDTFNNLHLESNNNDIVWGYSGLKDNAGERLTFRDCTIAGAIRGIKILNDFKQIAFENCSFDFLNNIIYVEASTQGMIKMSGGHIEAVGTSASGSDVKALPGYGYIAYYNSTAQGRLTVSINDMAMYLSSSTTDASVPHKFGTARVTDTVVTRNLMVKLRDVRMTPAQEIGKVNNIFLADVNTNIYYENQSFDTNREFYFASSNLDKEGRFDLYTNSNLNNYNIASYSASRMNVYDSSTKASDDIEPFFSKAIRLERDTSGRAVGIERTLKSLKDNNLRVLCIFKEATINIADNYYYNPALDIEFHNNNGVIVENSISLDIYPNNVMISEDRKWKAFCCYVRIPPSTEYIVVRSRIRFTDSAGTSYFDWIGAVDIGGFLVDFF